MAEVKTHLEDSTKPFTILVHIKVKDGAGPKFEAVFAKALAATRKEKRNKAYDLNRSTKRTDMYVVYERWQDLAAVQDHLQTPHITTLFAEVCDLLGGAIEGKVFLPVGE